MEGTIIILDCNNSQLKQANSICYQLIGNSIISGKKEDIGVLLLNSTESNNRFSDEEIEGYSYIQDYISMQPPNFRSFENLSKIVATEVENGDWLAALLVAWDILKVQSEFKKYKKTKIIVFTDFKGKPNKNHFEDVSKSITEEKTSIVFVSDFITMVENELGELHPSSLATSNQKHNAEIISKLQQETNCILRDYKHSFFEVINSKNSAPWLWSTTLTIGSKISMNISAYISSKSEFKLQLKTQSRVPDMQVVNSNKYFKNIEEIFPANDDLIKGFMLGSTPIAIDEELESKNLKSKKGLQCLFFTKEKSLSKNCFNGNGTYSVLPKKFSKQSSAMFNSLVHYLHQANIVMVAKKVYRDNTNPKIVALLPRIIDDIPRFIMIELFFSNQYIDVHFPKLNLKAFESNEQELKLVEDFINAKSLSSDLDLKNLPNLSLNFTINFLSNHVNGFEVLDKDGYFDTSSSVTDLIQQMKEHFTLESRKKPVNNKKEEEQNQQEQDDALQSDNLVDYDRIKQVGTVTPSENFLFLVARDVSQLNDRILQKQSFNRYAEEIQSVIERLLFKSVVIQTEKIGLALETYRKEAELYNPEDFNVWMVNLKNQIQSRKMTDFWENVVVKKAIGLISESPEHSFFSINKETVADTANEDDNRDVDDMFDEM